MTAVEVGPEALVVAVGSWLVLSRRRELGRLAWLTFAALVMILVGLIAGALAVRHFVGLSVADDGDALLRFLPWLNMIGTVNQVLSIGGLLLLILAIFAGRWRAARPEPAGSETEPDGAEIELGEVR